MKKSGFDFEENAQKALELERDQWEERMANQPAEAMERFFEEQHEHLDRLAEGK
jgi:hypothetical protein